MEVQGRPAQNPPSGTPDIEKLESESQEDDISDMQTINAQISDYNRSMTLHILHEELRTANFVASVATPENIGSLKDVLQSCAASLPNRINAFIAAVSIPGINGLIETNKLFRKELIATKRAAPPGPAPPGRRDNLIVKLAETSPPAPAAEARPPIQATQVLPPAPAPAPTPAARGAERQSQFRWMPGEETRIALRPIRHDDLWRYRKHIEGLHWTAQAVDLSKDRHDWTNRMTEDERTFVKMQLAFFARIDIDVLENLDENFGAEVDCLEARFFYAAQKDQECTHAESYSLQIEAVVDGAEREALLNAASSMPIIGKMRAWVKHWYRGQPLGDRLIAWAGIEGVLFSASFSSLQWLRERNLLPGITEMNKYIVRDENVHTSFTCLLIFKYLIDRPDSARAEAIFRGLIDILDEFVDESLPVSLIGINSKLMKQYVRFQADCVLIDMGFQPVYRMANPFQFMDKLTLNEVEKVNFFERHSTQYQSVTKEGSARLAVDASPVDDD